jgi:molecular chaperone IbpA
MVTKRYQVANMADILDNVRPFTLGFDRMFANLNNITDIANTSNYPPYNIIKQDDSHFNIEIAAAGFKKTEFNIHIIPGNNKQLVVQGVQDRGEDKQEYYYKGIGSRNFTRIFALTEDVFVADAEFVDGMLILSLERIIPEEKKAKEIKVR